LKILPFCGVSRRDQIATTHNVAVGHEVFNTNIQCPNRASLPAAANGAVELLNW